MKKVLALTLAGALVLVSAGCGKQPELEELPVLNYTAPAEGEEIVVIHVRDRGDIKIKLFPDLLPEACENFTALASSGYYDELIFHRVIENFMIQGGDPKGDGTGGESAKGGSFDGGYSPQLLHLPGAVAYANSGGTATDGSQFYIVTGDAVTEDLLGAISENNGTYFTDEAVSLYTEYGGAPHLDGGGYTVFGQVFEGLDIVYDISRVETNPKDDKPLDAVYMDSVTVETFDGGTVDFHGENASGSEDGGSDEENSAASASSVSEEDGVSDSDDGASDSEDGSDGSDDSDEEKDAMDDAVSDAADDVRGEEVTTSPGAAAARSAADDALADAREKAGISH